jgi:hypothetical protein
VPSLNATHSDEMFDSFDFLTSREQAVAVWAIGLSLVLAWKANAWRSLAEVVHGFLRPKVAGIFVAAAAYVALLVFVLHQAGVWHSWSLKETILWYFGTAAVTLFSWTEASRDPDYFRKRLAAAVRFSVAITFLVNFYVFSFWVEFFLVPLVLFVVLLSAAATTMEKSDPRNAALRTLNKAFQYFLGFVVVILLIHALKETIDDPHDLFSERTAEEIGVPLLLTVAFVPFIYAVALVGGYEMLFIRLEILLRRHPELASFAKRTMVRACGLRLARLNRFSGEWATNLMKADTKDEVEEVARGFARAMASEARS